MWTNGFRYGLMLLLFLAQGYSFASVDTSEDQDTLQDRSYFQHTVNHKLDIDLSKAQFHPVKKHQNHSAKREIAPTEEENIEENSSFKLYKRYFQALSVFIHQSLFSSKQPTNNSNWSNNFDLHFHKNPPRFLHLCVFRL